MRVSTVGANLTEYLFHQRQEVLGYLKGEASILVDVVVKCPTQLLETSESDKLESDVLIFHTFGNVILAFGPLILLATVSLANVVKNVLQLRNDR